MKSVSVMCVDHASSYGELYSQLATYGIETRPVNVNDEDFLEELGREPHALFIAPDAFAELEIIRSVSRWLPVFCFVKQDTTNAHWHTFRREDSFENMARSIRDVLLGVQQRRRRTRLSLHIKVEIGGETYLLTNGTMHEIWVAGLPEIDPGKDSDSIRIWNQRAQRFLTFQGKVIARRNDGAALAIHPETENDLLGWLDIYFEAEHADVQDQELDPVVEFFGKNN